MHAAAAEAGVLVRTTGQVEAMRVGEDALSSRLPEQ